MRPAESLKRMQFYQKKKYANTIQLNGPPLSLDGGGSHQQWKKLDPSEIVVHSLKCQDTLDDFLESQMREQYIKQLIKRAKHKAPIQEISDFVNG